MPTWVAIVLTVYVAIPVVGVIAAAILSRDN